MNDPRRQTVESGYDRVAEQYLATKNPEDPPALSALEKMSRGLQPGATFLKAGVADPDFDPGTFDAVLAFHSIVHVPREEHAVLLKRVRGWLRPGGLFPATLAVTGCEGEDANREGWGAAMRWSHYDAETNRKMLREAGFDLRYAEPRTSEGPGGAGETWLWVLARKDLG